jgi:hypothetical protein
MQAMTGFVLETVPVPEKSGGKLAEVQLEKRIF